MDHFQYVYLCDHLFSLDWMKGREVEAVITHRPGEDIEVLIPHTRILEIIKVEVIDYDPISPPVETLYDNDEREQTYEDVNEGDGIYDVTPEWQVDYSQYIGVPLPNHFYDVYLHNMIKWNVNPPKRYRVTMRIVYLSEIEKPVPPDECERCDGKGWYIDILDRNQRFQTPEGIWKIVQRVLKDLLTPLGTQKFDPFYGKQLDQEIAEQKNDDERLFGNIRMIVSQVEDEYLERQKLEPYPLTPAETMVYLRCTNVFRSPKNLTRIFVELVIRNMEEERMIRFAF